MLPVGIVVSCSIPTLIMKTSFDQLKSRLEQAQSKADKAEGRYEQLMEELQQKYGCKTLKEAKKLLSRLQKEESAAEEALQDSIAKFEEEFGDYL